MSSKVAIKVVGSGNFLCPDCKNVQPYKKKEARKRFTLLGVGIGRGELIDTFIECASCGHTYDMEVLGYRPPTSDEVLTYRAEEDLKLGTPLSVVAEKIRRMGYSRDEAEEIAKRALGEKYRWCPSCEEAYHLQVQECSYCGEKPSRSDEIES